MQIYRIGDSRHPLWDGTGAAMVGGRWNSPGRPVIYGSLSYACAILEILMHANIGRIPATQVYVIPSVVATLEWNAIINPPAPQRQSVFGVPESKGYLGPAPVYAPEGRINLTK